MKIKFLKFILAGVALLISFLAWSQFSSIQREPKTLEKNSETWSLLDQYQLKPTLEGTIKITPFPTLPIEHHQPTALCRDGTYSYSQNRSGTCSWHGGVLIWY